MVLASFLYIAYKVTLPLFIFNDVNPVVASLLVFHPTNVHPDLLAVGVRSMASP